MTDSFTSDPLSAAASFINEVPAWDRFVAAKTSDEFFHSWLELVCNQIPSTIGAAILIESVEAHTFVPIATWPSDKVDLSHLGSIVERTLKEKRGIVQPFESDDAPAIHIAYPILLGGNVAGAVVLDTACASESVRAALQHIHWGIAWLSNMLGRRDQDNVAEANDRIVGVMETVAIGLRHGKLQQVLFEVSNELRLRFNCSRVVIGLVKDAAVKIAAFSDTATFEKSTPLVKAYKHAMEEAYDQGALIQQRKDSETQYAEHQQLLEHSGADEVLSCLLMQGPHCVGIIVLEQSGETGFQLRDRLWLEAFSALFASVIEQRQEAERSSFGRFARESKNLLNKFFGPRHLVWKLGATLTLLSIAILSLVQLDYRVSSKAVVEGEIQRVIAAPFEGFIGNSYVRAGDEVRQGQLLVQLDDRDLRVDQAKSASERDQYERRLREAMANHDLTAMQVIGAQLNQAEAQLKLVTEKIARAHLTAPFDGVVVSGDLSQQMGSPVESGKKLFEIAPLQSYRVILQVDEREIRNVMIGQHGQLVITGIARDPMRFQVSKVTPVATAQDGKNFFRVEASFDHSSLRLRPGMEGISKIEVGKRQLWWILTHSFTDWLRLSLWTWLP